MATFIITFIIMALVVIGMAIGVIAGRPAIKGSCGGLNNVGIDSDCACSRQEREKCKTIKNNR